MMNSMQSSSRTIDRTGQQLEDYRLVRALALGRSSGTYLGEHVQRQAQYMVKVWETRLEEMVIKDFLRQARRLSELNHPHILPVRDANVDDAVPFVVMDYLPHVTLQQRDTQGVPQPLIAILPSLNPIAEALQYAHNKGILHQHVQPANILLDNRQRVLLSNFGIDTVDRNTQQPLVLTKEAIRESLGYIAPEQIEGKAVPASDQYGLAVVIYEWLSGKLPFRGSYAELARQQRSALPPPLYPDVPGVSRVVEETIFIALAKDPARRFPSIAHFVQALQEAQQRSAAPVFPLAGSVKPAPPSPALPPPLPVMQGPQPTPNIVAAQAAMAPNMLPSLPMTPQFALPVQAAMAPNMPPAFPMTPQPALPAPLPSAQRRNASVKSAVPVYRQRQQKPGITRRAFVAGLLGTAVVGGAAAWLAFGPKMSQPPATDSGPSGKSGQTPTPIPGNIFTYYGHRARVSSVAWSPDGRRIASASDDHLVLICDSQHGKTLLTYSGHSAPVYALAWSPNGKYIASAGADNTVRVWDAASGKTITIYSGHTDVVNAVSWSHQGNRIASGSQDHTVQVWNALTGASVLTYTGHAQGVLAVAWSPNDAAIATGSWDNTVQAFSMIATQSFKVGGVIFNYGGHSAEVYAVVWSPDGKHLASASGDHLVYVQNGTNGKTIFQFAGHSDVVFAVAWSPDGTYLASASEDNTAQVWSANEVQGVVARQSLFTYNGHSNAVYAVAWSPDSARLASGSADDTVQVWHMV